VIEVLRLATVTEVRGLRVGESASVPADLVEPHEAGSAAGGQPPARVPGLVSKADQALFTQFVLDYAAARPGTVISILQAGCATVGQELDLEALRAHGIELELDMIDDASSVTRAVIAQRPDLSDALLGELRSIPLRPRSYDIVQCSMLLGRISNAELVLGRLVDALRPSGLLLLRTPDRDSAAVFLDRVLPRPARRLAWHMLKPGEPGPYPAVYEQISSARGIQAFIALRGLAVARRQVVSRVSGGKPYLVAACRIVARLSRSRLSWSHDELRYVIRKPEDRFARVL
jgi:SAM-dependent methyltransferase